MSLTRRWFLASGITAAALPLVNAMNNTTSPASPPIIDTHIHVWDLKTLNPPWLASAEPILRRR